MHLYYCLPTTFGRRHLIVVSQHKLDGLHICIFMISCDIIVRLISWNIMHLIIIDVLVSVSFTY
ncbi:hypothetical protein Scep_024348 [Stephania cephalantha]|uniref:Uncharacterized protein n=1 Tax=Stephania cephalantha TaxID=152367 RepID=A0AAP0HTL3_9MAGN